MWAGADVELMLGGCMETGMLVLTILGVVLSAVAAAAGVYAVILTRQGNRTSDEQLRLQREQAAMIPRLRVANIRFLRPDDLEEVRDTLRHIEAGRRRARAEEEQYERDMEAWRREQQRPGASRLNPQPMSRERRHLMLDQREHPERYYEGLTPTAILDLRLVNDGKVAAHDISGTLLLQHPHLQPIEGFPRMDASEVSGPEEGFYRVNVVGIRELLPGDEITYRVALRATPPGEDNMVEIGYEFITPAGFPLSGNQSVELAPSTPREHQ
jgi:hypothetical protein